MAAAASAILLSSLSSWQTVCGLTGAYWVLWIVYCRYFHPLRTAPGPFLASVSRSWIVWKTCSGDMEYTQRALHARYGYLVRIAPNEVACSDPEAIKIIYGIKSQFKKTDFYDAWAPPGGGWPGHFPERDEKVHGERRKIVNSIFSMSSVLESETSVDDCTREFCKVLHEFASQNSVVDLGQWFNMYAFDVLGELFYGERFGFIKDRVDYNNYMASLESFLPALTIGGTVPSYLTPLVIPFTLLWPSVRGAIKAIGHINASSIRAVEQRQAQLETNQDNKRDMLRKMLEINADRGEKINFTVPNVITESTSSLFAGADTTAIALRSVLYYLMQHPSVYSRVTAEIDEATSNGALSEPITYGQAIKLPYLAAVIKESMRLHPSVGLTMPREVPEGGATISGLYFPAGYRVGMNAAVVHYDKGVFGEDADEFNPSRWLDGDAAAMERAMLSFGAGTRTCIGKNISLSEIYKLVPELLRQFHFRLADPSKPWKTRNFWFNKQTGIEVFIEERG